MKTPTIFFLFVSLFPTLLQAQCQNYTMPFLILNTDTHYIGLAATGVTTSGNGQVFLPWQENPALLGSAQDVFAVKSNVYRQLRFSPTLLDINAQRPLSERLTLGVDAKFYSLSKITFTDMNGDSLGTSRPLEYAISSSLGIQLNDHFSLGGGLSFIHSDLTGGAPNNLNIRPAHGFAVHLGVHYRGQKELSEMARLNFEAGLSITNIGPRVSYASNSFNGDYIPATLQLGGQFGWEGDIKGSQSFGVSIIAQIDHSLVPDCSFEDADGNGRYDYLEQSVIGGAFSSFGDHPDGFGGEAKAWTKRIAFHPWVDLNADWKLGIGLGLINYNHGDAANLATLGMNLAYKNFQLEASNIGQVEAGNGGALGWSFSLGYHGSLEKG